MINNQPNSTGTDFFYRFSIGDNKFVGLILINRHVIGNNKAFSFFFHELDDKQSPQSQSGPLGKSISITIDDISSLWVPHPDPNVDLVAILFSPIEAKIRNEQNKQIFRIALDDTIIKSDDELEQISSVGDEVLMVGYPIGLWDKKANFPIIRKSISATHSTIDFEGNSIGIVDVACFSGSSGSPILIVKEGIHTNKKRNTALGSNIAILLGLLFAGPFNSKEGDIEIKEIPTKRTMVTNYQQMIHLGYYVKVKEILKLCEQIKEK